MSAQPALLTVDVQSDLRLWSVTTLIKQGLGTSEPLVNWAVKTTANAAIDQSNVVAAMMQVGDRDGAVEHLTRARYRRSGKAMARGTEIHRLAEAIAKGEQPHVEPEHAPYVDQYRRWLDRFQPEFVMAEAPVYNPAEHYAGTCDGVMLLSRVPVVFDLKTTEHPPGGDKMRPPFSEVALQLCAYARATHVGVISEQRYASGKRYYLFNPNVPHEPMPRVESALAIVISPYDCIAVPTRIDDEVWDSFVHVMEAARWQLFTSKSLFGPPLAAPSLNDQEGT